MVARTVPQYDTFAFTHRSLDGRSVRLGYALTARSGARVDFEETFELPESLGPLVGAGRPAVARALLGLHLAAGTSYWKTCLPGEIVVDGTPLTDDDAGFWSRVYTLGLAEFFYRNQIDPAGRASFRAVSGTASSPADGPVRPGSPLLLWGGGKDSVVSHEVLAASGERHELLSIGRPDWRWIRRSAETSGAVLHGVARRLDPKLFAMNEAGALNGHVPVSAVLALAGTLVAALTDRGPVVASNESSASFGNASWRGLPVNHQWSKSLEFERLFQRWLRGNLAGAAEYFSLLRPLTELRIVKAFSTHPGYFEAVTSCNANFGQSGPAARRFCLTCAKCVFIGLMTRPWVDDKSFHTLFGGDPLADPSNVTIVEELLGLRGTKPFECVGTPEETIAALHLARRNGRTIPHGIMTAFASRVADTVSDLDAIASSALARSTDHLLPPARIAQLDAYLDRH